MAGSSTQGKYSAEALQDQNARNPEPTEAALLAGLSNQPGNPDLELALAIHYSTHRRYAEASDRLLSVLKTRPADFEALIWLSIVKRSEGDFDLAIAFARQAISAQPQSAVAHNALGQCFLIQRIAVPAIDAFRAAMECDPSMVPACTNLGKAYQLLELGTEAAGAFLKAVQLAPTEMNGYVLLSDQLLNLSRTDEAIEWLERGRRQFPSASLILLKLAMAYAAGQDAIKAEKFFRLAISYDHSIEAAYGMWLQEQGRTEESTTSFTKSIAAMPQQGFAYFGLAQSAPDLVTEEMMAEMERLMNDAHLHPKERMFLAYAGGRAYEGRKEYEKAMTSFDQANDLAYRIHVAGRVFDHAYQAAKVERSIRSFAEPSTSLEPSSSEKPIFIVGMVRSGTTLMEQIISSHPEVAAAGELRFWVEEGAKEAKKAQISKDLASKYLAELDRWAPGAARVTDKMPLNYSHLGLIHRTFPNARIVHVKRDPVDTCLSIYTTYLGSNPSFAYRRENIVVFYQQYLRVMEFWRQALPKDRLLEIDYESLVQDPEPLIAQILEFCDLSWDPACLHPEENRSAIRTPSLWQARRPIKPTSVERWRRYEPWLREFRSLIE